MVRRYPFCVHLIQNIKGVILRWNLVLTLEWLIDIPPPPLLINFSIFFQSEHSFSTPLLLRTPLLLIIGESFQPEFETIYLCWLFLRSRKRIDPSVCVCFASSCKEANIAFCFVSYYKEANLFPITDLILQK